MNKKSSNPKTTERAALLLAAIVIVAILYATGAAQHWSDPCNWSSHAAHCKAASR